MANIILSPEQLSIESNKKNLDLLKAQLLNLEELQEKDFSPKRATQIQALKLKIKKIKD